MAGICKFVCASMLMLLYASVFCAFAAATAAGATDRPLAAAASKDGAGAAAAPPMILLLSDAAHLNALAPGGACRHLVPRAARLFRAAAPALAARLSGANLAALRACLPPGAVAAVDADLTVKKTEGPVNHGKWWEATAEAAAAAEAATQFAVNGSSDSRSIEKSNVALNPIQLWRLKKMALQARAALSRAHAPKPAAAAAGGNLPARARNNAIPAPVANASQQQQQQGQAAVRASDGPPAGEEAAAVAAAESALANVYEGDGAGAGGDADGIPPPPAAAAAEPPSSRRVLTDALWNLDRTDNRRRPPLDGVFEARATGRGVTIYALDSGVRPGHREFGGRARLGPDFTGGRRTDPTEANDCDGHGTHVASTAVGRAVGVAPGAELVAVRVLDCNGSGAISDVVAGLDWVAANAVRPAVATLSLGVPAGNYTAALDAAMRAVVARGITVVVAAGNDRTDACGVAPANVPEAITVAATNLPSKFDGGGGGGREGSDILYTWGNTGACVALLAPGVDIFAACAADKRCGAAGDDAYAWASGTSMAVPAVAGAAALLLERDPGMSPADVKNALLRGATRGAVDLGVAAGTGMTDALLYVNV